LTLKIVFRILRSVAVLLNTGVNVGNVNWSFTGELSTVIPAFFLEESWVFLVKDLVFIVWIRERSKTKGYCLVSQDNTLKKCEEEHQKLSPSLTT
jgi:hypothetical protein